MKRLNVTLLAGCICASGMLFAEPDTTAGLATLDTLTAPTEVQMPFVVVEEFVNRTDTDATAFEQLKNRIEHEIINTRKFTYLERGEKLENAMAERRRRAAGAVQDPNATPETATDNPPLLVAGYAIYGDILFFGLEQKASEIQVLNSLRTTAKMEVQIRLANIDTGEVLASKIVTKTSVQTTSAPADVKIQSNFTDKSLSEVVHATAHEVVKALMELAYPARVIAVNAKRNTFIVNLTQEQTAVNAVYDIFETGEELFDPDTGKSLGVVEELIGRATVTRCQPKMAFMKPMEDLKIAEIKRGMLVRAVDDATIQKERQQQQRQGDKKYTERF